MVAKCKLLVRQSPSDEGYNKSKRERVMKETGKKEKIMPRISYRREYC